MRQPLDGVADKRYSLMYMSFGWQTLVQGNRVLLQPMSGHGLFLSY